MKKLIFLLLPLFACSCSTSQFALKQKQEQTDSNPSDAFGLEEPNILFLIGDRQVNESELKQIDLGDIASIEIVEDPALVKSYTLGVYDGVVLINLRED